MRLSDTELFMERCTDSLGDLWSDATLDVPKAVMCVYLTGLQCSLGLDWMRQRFCL